MKIENWNFVSSLLSLGITHASMVCSRLIAALNIEHFLFYLNIEKHEKHEKLFWAGLGFAFDAVNIGFPS